MLNTLSPGDICLAIKANHPLSGYTEANRFRRGDIVFIKTDNSYKVKRLIGYNTDTIEIINGVIKINGVFETVRTSVKLELVLYDYNKYMHEKYKIISNDTSLNKALVEIDMKNYLNLRNNLQFKSQFSRYNLDYSMKYFTDSIMIYSRDNMIFYPNSDLNHKSSFKYKGFFLVGDNRMHSIDSRSIGFYNEDQIIGTLCFCI